MPIPVVLAGLKMRFSGTIDSGEWTNIFNFTNNSGPGTVGDLNSTASDAATSWNAHLAPLLCSNVKLSQVEVLDTSVVPNIAGVWSGVHAGTVAQNLLYAQSCVLISHQVARRYKGGHPRTYLPGPAATQSADATQILGSFQTSLGTAFTAFINGILAISHPTVQPTVYTNVSYRTGGAARSTPLVEQILGSTVELKIATQRRRVQR